MIDSVMNLEQHTSCWAKAKERTGLNFGNFKAISILHDTVTTIDLKIRQITIMLIYSLI